MLCCGFELLGSNHDVALPCPSAATLKVLGGTHPALCGSWGLGLQLEPAPAHCLTAGLTSDGCRVRDMNQVTLWAGEGQTEPEVSAGLRCWHPAWSSCPQPGFVGFAPGVFPGCSACTEVVLLWWGPGSSSQTQSKCWINKLCVFAKVHLGF